MPRAFLARRVEVVPDESTMRRVLSDPAFNPRGIAYVEAGSGIDAFSAPSATADRVRISARDTDCVTIEVVNDAPGLLVLADTFYPGWKAHRDGEEVPIVPVDWGLRGVLLPPGSHVVEMRYRPDWLVPAFVVSLSGLLVALAATARRPRLPAFRSVRSRSGSRPPRCTSSDT